MTPTGHPSFESLTQAPALISHDQLPALQRYAEALLKLNESINLTAHRTLEAFVVHHAVDVLAALRTIEEHDSATRWVDLGSGGGIPGIVWAIARPRFQLSLSDSAARKVQALRTLVAECGLDIPVINPSEAKPPSQNTRVVARAVAPLAKLIKWAPLYTRDRTILWALKGRRETLDLEVASLPEAQQAQIDIFPVHDPRLSAERHVVRWRSRVT